MGMQAKAVMLPPLPATAPTTAARTAAQTAAPTTARTTAAPIAAPTATRTAARTAATTAAEDLAAPLWSATGSRASAPFRTTLVPAMSSGLKSQLHCCKQLLYKNTRRLGVLRFSRKDQPPGWSAPQFSEKHTHTHTHIWTTQFLSSYLF